MKSAGRKMPGDAKYAVSDLIERPPPVKAGASLG